MTNKHRGEVAITVGGETYTLCLTLGALAEIETALGVDGAGQLGERLQRRSSADTLLVLGALLRGGHEISDPEVKRLPISPLAGFEAMVRAFTASDMMQAGPGDAEQSPGEPAKN